MDLRPTAGDLLWSGPGLSGEPHQFGLARQYSIAWANQAFGLGVERSALIRASIVLEAVRRGLVDLDGHDLRWTESAIVGHQQGGVRWGRRNHVIRISRPLKNLMDQMAKEDGVTFHGWFYALSRKRFADLVG